MATTPPSPDPSAPSPAPTTPIPAPAPSSPSSGPTNGGNGADPSKVAAAIQSLSDDDRMLLLAALGVPDAMRQRIARDRAAEAAVTAQETPLYRSASVNPIDVEATKAMTGAKAASLVGVNFDDVQGYAVRAPRNVDGEPISERDVLIVVLNDGSKVAVSMADQAQAA